MDNDKLTDIISQFILAIAISFFEDMLKGKNSKYNYSWCLEDEYYHDLNQHIKVYTGSDTIEGTITEVGSDFIKIITKNNGNTYIIPKSNICFFKKDHEDKTDYNM